MSFNSFDMTIVNVWQKIHYAFLAVFVNNSVPTVNIRYTVLDAYTESWNC